MATKEKGKQTQKTTSVSTKMKWDDESKLKVNKWDTSALKNALDDTVKKIMKEEFEYVEDHSLVDQRLVICTVACLFSLFALVYDYVFPFPASRIILATCAISYFVLMGVLTLFSMYHEGSIFMVALQKDKAGVGVDNVWRLSSTLPRFGDTYTLTFSFTNGQTKTTTNNTLKKCVAEYFDENGKLVVDKFFTDVKSLHTDTNKSKKDQ